MSTPAPARPVDAIQSTQKQLDELDELIQRMLTLPVNQLEEEPLPELPALPPLPEPLALSSTTSEPASLPAHSRDESWKAPEPARETPPAFRAQPHDEEFVSAPAWQRAEADSLPPRPLEQEEESPVSNRSVSTESASEHSAPRAAWWLRLLIRTNRAFDRCTLTFGTPGRRLRGERGRAFLGWAGLLLLVAALTWALLDWIGLTW